MFYSSYKEKTACRNVFQDAVLIK